MDYNGNTNNTENGNTDKDIFMQAIATELVQNLPITVDIALQLIEVSKRKDEGDYCVSLPKLKRFKVTLEQGIPETAVILASKIKPNDYFSEVKASGPFLNFRLNKVAFVKKILHTVMQQKTQYGTSEEGKSKRILVEYSSPNIAKPFHAGHLRSTVIGNFIFHLHKNFGYDVVSLNYLGDWGKQYGLLATGFQKYGSEAELDKAPIRHLFDVYVNINKDKKADPAVDDEARAYFKRMEQGGKGELALWKKFRELSIREYTQMYKRLNINFDVYSGESLVVDQVPEQMEILKKKGLLVESEGAQIVDLTAYNLNKPLVVKKDGTTLYLTRDIATALSRWNEHKFEKMFYVVAAQQDLHFQQLFKILELMGYDWAKRCHHINFGMVEGMSTRKGNVVFLHDILDEAQTSMLEVMKKNDKKYQEVEDPAQVSDMIGISAVVTHDFTARRIKNYSLDWSVMTSFEGKTGPYLQYAHARLCNIERKAAEQGLHVPESFEAVDFSNLEEKEAFDLALQISLYPTALKKALQQLEPCVLVAYQFELAAVISLAHEKLRVLGSQQEVAVSRLVLFWAARVTLGNALKIMGLIPLHKM